MVIDLDLPATLLIGPEVALASCALHEAVAAALALAPSQQREASILYYGGGELELPGILALAKRAASRPQVIALPQPAGPRPSRSAHLVEPLAGW